MAETHEIARVELADSENRFRLEALEWRDDDPDEGHVIVSVEITTGAGTWKSRAASVLPLGLGDVASAAASAARGAAGDGFLDYAAEGAGTAVAFSFRFLPDERCVVATVVVDGDLVPDGDEAVREDADTVLIRVPPREVVAFAEALEEIAAREPGHVLWAG